MNDAQNVLFGPERTLAALNCEPDAEPKAVLSNVMAGIDAFVSDAEQFDDITMLCFRYNGTVREGHEKTFYPDHAPQLAAIILMQGGDDG